MAGFLSWLSQFLNRRPAEPPALIDRHRPYLDSLIRPALRLVKADAAGRSRLGGLPDMPESLSWPEWQDRPLAFLAQIDLGELPPESGELGLPSSGLLFFFYDSQQEAWGFDPADRGAWRVLYAPAAGAERTAPAMLDTDAIYPVTPVGFQRVTTYPEPEDPALSSLNFNFPELGCYGALRNAAAGGYGGHHLMGYPDPVQNGDMERECALVTGGLYCGDASGYNDPRADALSRHRDDWVMLLQLDSDDDAGMMWGDVGTLYFWIRKQDLAASHFADCWMISQCH